MLCSPEEEGEELIGKQKAERKDRTRKREGSV